MAENGEQNAPIMAGSDDATNDEKIDGILAQVRQDFGGHDLTTVTHNLHQRFDEANVQIDDITLENYAQEISGE